MQTVPNHSYKIIDKTTNEEARLFAVDNSEFDLEILEESFKRSGLQNKVTLFKYDSKKEEGFLKLLEAPGKAIILIDYFLNGHTASEFLAKNPPLLNKHLIITISGLQENAVINLEENKEILRSIRYICKPPLLSELIDIVMLDSNFGIIIRKE